MPKLYFLGGEDVIKGDSTVHKKIFNDIGGLPSVLIFHWTTESADKTDRYRDIIVNYFQNLGLRKIIFAELSDSFQEIQEKIETSDVIYLPGGNPKLLIDRMKDAKVDNLLRNYNKVIIGNSAGALALCKDYAIIKGQDETLKTGVGHGLGLVDFSVSVHYKSSKHSGLSPDQELKTLSEKTETKIYAVPEQGALIYENGNFKFIGNISLFAKGKKNKILLGT